MTKETMTVHKGLSELKVLEKRINDSMRDATFVNAAKHSATKIDGMSIQDYKEYIKSSMDKVQSLMNRRVAIKKAILLSNSKTMVTINGVTYTVVEAIEDKASTIRMYKNLLHTLQAEYGVALSTYNRHSGESLESDAERHMLSVLGANAVKDGKVSAETITAIKNDYMANNQYDMIDPLNIAKRISDLKDYIDSFESEVDAALSASNALTVIEIEY